LATTRVVTPRFTVSQTMHAAARARGGNATQGVRRPVRLAPSPRSNLTRRRPEGRHRMDAPTRILPLQHAVKLPRFGNLSAWSGSVKFASGCAGKSRESGPFG